MSTHVASELRPALEIDGPLRFRSAQIPESTRSSVGSWIIVCEKWELSVIWGILKLLDITAGPRMPLPRRTTLAREPLVDTSFYAVEILRVTASAVPHVPMRGSAAEVSLEVVNRPSERECAECGSAGRGAGGA
jgi:hypothetical protein